MIEVYFITILDAEEYQPPIWKSYCEYLEFRKWEWEEGRKFIRNIDINKCNLELKPRKKA